MSCDDRPDRVGEKKKEDHYNHFMFLELKLQKVVSLVKLNFIEYTLKLNRGCHMTSSLAQQKM